MHQDRHVGGKEARGLSCLTLLTLPMLELLLLQQLVKLDLALDFGACPLFARAISTGV